MPRITLSNWLLGIADGIFTEKIVQSISSGRNKSHDAWRKYWNKAKKRKNDDREKNAQSNGTTRQKNGFTFYVGSPKIQHKIVINLKQFDAAVRFQAWITDKMVFLVTHSGDSGQIRNSASSFGPNIIEC